jgi:hypothetical protein
MPNDREQLDQRLGRDDDYIRRWIGSAVGIVEG